MVTDISEIKRAEHALSESEERFRLAFEEAPIGMALVALDGRFIRVNRVLCEIVGYTPEELMEQTFQAITHPEDLDTDLALMGKLTRGEIPRYQLGKRYLRKDGTTVDVMLHGAVLRSREGTPLYFIAQIEDITARKQLEDRLRLAEATSSGILAISADAIISIDEEQRITLFNDGAERIFGYSRTEALGAPLGMLLPERLRAMHQRHLTEFSKGQTVARQMGERSSVILGLRKSGEEFPASATISKLNVGGNSIYTVELRDITEQKKIENEQRFLAEAGLVLATTFDYEQTLKKVADLAVQYVTDFCVVELVQENGEVLRLVVTSRDPSRAWACEALMRMKLDRRRPHLMKTVLETRQPVFLQRPAAETIAALAQSEEHHRALEAVGIRSMVAVPLVIYERLLGAVAFISTSAFREYTPADLHLAEELARRAAVSIENARLYHAARRATQARDDVLGIVAHDLRNPLNTLLMQASLLRNGQAEPEHRARKSAELIERAATRMSRLIEDLLDVTRLDAGQLSVAQARVPVLPLVSDAVEAHRPLATSASLALRLEAAPEFPEVWADRDRLLQIFENLVGNALKFSKPGGRITIGAAPGEGAVRFWVSDTGSGIPAENLPHLFERFWQARKGERRGAGLGLAIVKGLVEAHGGRIWVESLPGQGSTFFFTIPVVPQEEVEPDTGLFHA